jgi:hypothetical protein
MAATFKIECPACNASIRAPLSIAGTKTSCPGCGQRILIPDQRNKTMLAKVIDDGPPPHPPSLASRPVPAPVLADIVDEDDVAVEPSHGTAILVMGLVGMFTLPFIFGPITWLWADEELRKMKAGRMDPEGKANTETGRLMGIISTVIGVIAVVLIFLYCAGVSILFRVFGAAANK